MADVVEINVTSGTTSERQFTGEEQTQRSADQQQAAVVSEQRAVETANDTTLRDRLITGYDAMKTHVDRGTFTAAQRDAALLLCLRGVMALIRITLRRLDAVD